MADITARSSFDTCREAINEAVKEWMLDQPEIAAETGEDEIWADMAASLLVDANPKVAEEVCKFELGHVPQALRKVWVQRDEAKREADREKSRRKTRELREAREAAEKAARVAERDQIRAARCPNCFVVKTPAGMCNC